MFFGKNAYFFHKKVKQIYFNNCKEYKTLNVNLYNPYVVHSK